MTVWSLWWHLLPQGAKDWRATGSWSKTGTGWDLKPVTLCCSACTGTNISCSNIIQRNYKELKITVFMGSWDKLWTSYKKTKNAAVTSEELGTEAWQCTCPLHSTPPKGSARHASHPTRFLHTPIHTPTLTPYKGSSLPALGASEQGNLLSVSASLCCSKDPNKALLDFLVWPHQFLLRKANNPGLYQKNAGTTEG